jgi:hypothetical protein
LHANIGVERNKRVPPVVPPAREADLADDADEAPAGNKNAEGLVPNAVQFAEDLNLSSLLDLLFRLAFSRFVFGNGSVLDIDISWGLCAVLAAWRASCEWSILERFTM